MHTNSSFPFDFISVSVVMVCGLNPCWKWDKLTACHCLTVRTAGKRPLIHLYALLLLQLKIKVNFLTLRLYGFFGCISWYITLFASFYKIVNHHLLVFWKCIWMLSKYGNPMQSAEYIPHLTPARFLCSDLWTRKNTLLHNFHLFCRIWWFSIDTKVFNMNYTGHQCWKRMPT